MLTGARRSPQVRVKSFEEATATVHREHRANRGPLTNRARVILVGVGVIGALLARWVALGAATILALDFIVFVVWRWRMLRAFENGVPRLTTSADLARIDEAFREAGREQPSMTDYERAAGVAGHPSWRTDLRYQNLIALGHPLKDQIILDVGTGDGRLAWKYRAHAEARAFIGVDISFDLLAKFKQHMPDALAVVCDLNDGLPFRRDSVTRVLCTEAFEHFAEPGRVLEEFGRVVTPGGKIVIQSPSAMQLRNLNPFHVLQCLVGRFIPSMLMPIVVHENTWVTAYTHHWDFTIQHLQKLARPLGLRIGRTVCAMYRFNPKGSALHRIGHALSARFPLKHLGWDRTVVIERPGRETERTVDEVGTRHKVGMR